jgi:hypothetical protein
MRLLRSVIAEIRVRQTDREMFHCLMMPLTAKDESTTHFKYIAAEQYNFCKQTYSLTPFKCTLVSTTVPVLFYVYRPPLSLGALLCEKLTEFGSRRAIKQRTANASLLCLDNHWTTFRLCSSVTDLVSRCHCRGLLYNNQRYHTKLIVTQLRMSTHFFARNERNMLVQYLRHDLTR